MWSKSIFFLVSLITLPVLLVGCQQKLSESTNGNSQSLAQPNSEVSAMMLAGQLGSDQQSRTLNQQQVTLLAEIIYDYFGQLTDVTQAKTIRGVMTAGNASGVARSMFYDDTYYLLATFANLPAPQNGDFYEGWLVRKDPFDFISTGPVTTIDGAVVNGYVSNQDLTDHNFYVLTLEPDDGNPAPADHIVAGTMQQLDAEITE